VIARAGAILRALSGHPQGVSLSSLAKQVDLPRLTTHRIVSALQEEDFVIGGSDGVADLAGLDAVAAMQEALDPRVRR
jgi:IclR family transcriptional regulator, acetate operon repressor